MARQEDQPRTAPTVFRAFYHLACLPGWQAIFHEQLESFQKASLKPLTFVLGTPEDAQYVERHLPVLGSEANLDWFETPTLDQLHRWATDNPDGAVLYCHSKGVSSPKHTGKAVWRQLMTEQVIYPWQALLARLAHCDALGVNLCHNPGGRHFSGNFWVARNDWIARLLPPWQHRNNGGWWRPWQRMHAEAWVLSQSHYHVESLACRNQRIWEESVCRRYVAPSVETSPERKPHLTDDDIRRLVRHPGATDRMPERLRATVQAILQGCQCHFRREIDPLIPQLREFF